MTQRTGDSGNKIQQVVDFTEARSQRLEEKRRRTERIFFKQMLGVYSVTDDGQQMRPIELLDVSEDGCSFQVPYDGNKPWPTELKDMPLRLYFSQDTYIPVVIRIENSRQTIDGGVRYVRYGCTVDKSLSSYPAFQQFVKFLKLYAEHAHKDMGDISVFYL